MATRRPRNDEAAGSGSADNDLSQAIRASAQQIWLAGMGAFAKAQEEGGKVFEALVKEGSALQGRTRKAAEDRFGDAASKAFGFAEEAAHRAEAAATEMNAKAFASWDKLEGVFEGRTAKALNRLGVPSAADVAALQSRVGQLEAQVAQLMRKSPGAKAARPHSAARQPGATAKSATKSAATKTPVRRKTRKATADDE